MSSVGNSAQQFLYKPDFHKCAQAMEEWRACTEFEIYYFLISGVAEPWAPKEVGGTLIEAKFQEGEILTLSKWDKFYVISALLNFTSLMAWSIFVFDFLIFQPLLEMDYEGVIFAHVSSHFHLFRRYKIDGVFRFSRRVAQPSANGSMRYMMWILCTSSFISLWDALCLVDPCWYMSCGILLCVVIDVPSAMDLCHVWVPFMPHWRDALIFYVYFWDPLFSRIDGILLFATCQLWSYW